MPKLTVNTIYFDSSSHSIEYKGDSLASVLKSYLEEIEELKKNDPIMEMFVEGFEMELSLDPNDGQNADEDITLIHQRLKEFLREVNEYCDSRGM